MLSSSFSTRCCFFSCKSGRDLSDFKSNEIWTPFCLQSSIQSIWNLSFSLTCLHMCTLPSVIDAKDSNKQMKNLPIFQKFLPEFISRIMNLILVFKKRIQVTSILPANCWLVSGLSFFINRLCKPSGKHRQFLLSPCSPFLVFVLV